MTKNLFYSLSVLALGCAICLPITAKQDKVSITKPQSSAKCIGDICANESLEKMIYETVKKDPAFLDWVVEQGHSALLQTMLEHESELEIGFKLSESNLVHLAARHNEVDALKILKDAKFDINSKDAEDFRPVHKAAQYGALETLQWLIANGVDIDTQSPGLGADKGTPLYIAAVKYQWDVARWLLENGASPNFTNDNLFSLVEIAIRSNEPDIVELAIKKGAIFENRELELTLTFHYVSMAKLLLSHKANSRVTPDELNSAFNKAVRDEQLEMAALLLDHGAAVNSEEGGFFSPLMEAILNNQIKMVELLLAHNVNVNQVSKQFHTSPLLYAMLQKNEVIIDLLKKHGAVENPSTVKTAGQNSRA